MADSSEVRKRKKRSNITHTSGHSHQEVPAVGASQPQWDRGRHTGGLETPQERASALTRFLGWVSFVIGITLMVVAGLKHAAYMYTLHENDLWFSNIKEMEREISFRTESGLYYSYYKQMLQAPSVWQGIRGLLNDNKTEHLRSINVLARMNIYQEVFLAAIYRSIPILQEWVEPVYFYIDTVFFLHGLLVCALYAITWMLSRSWLAGLLTTAFYIFNKEDTTRVSFVVPLRESFSLPFLWLQLAFITYYFKPTVSKTIQRLCVAAIAVSTFLFSATWQFNQFLLLLQAMALFTGQVLELLPLHKVRSVYVTQMGALLLVALLQFGNTMILSGMCLSFILAALCVMWMQSKLRPVGIVRQTVTVIFQVIFVFALAAVLNILAKVVTQQEADEHIGKFVLTKFGILGEKSQRDFDVRLYLCNGAFTFLGWDLFERMTRTLVFPIYTYVHAVSAIMLVIAFLQKARHKPPQPSTHMFHGRPDLVYHLIQAVFFGALAVTTLRMKYLWTPYMCILAAVGVSDQAIATTLFAIIGVRSSWKVSAVRHLLTLIVLSSFLHLVLPRALEDLEDLREFYDPDTVDLMTWIKLETPPGAALAGSMQLLAGVKLCTDRPITNHPHYEDKALRQRTLELYQMYGRRTPEEVHSILVKFNASYIILEDSICLAASRGGCRLPDLIDVSNGVLPDSGSPLQGLVQSRVPRFCDEVRHGTPAYSKYFKLLFGNKTFRVYQVLVQ